MNALKHYKSVGLFYFLSTLLPWLFWFMAGFVSHQQYPNLFLLTALGLLGLVSPMCVVMGMAYKNKSLQVDILDRFSNFERKYWRYYLLALCLLLTSILLAQAISLLFGYSSSQFVITGKFSFTSGVLPVWFLLLIAPALEELAWHSYGTDALREKFNLFWTSIIFGAYWAVWHFPLSSIKGYYQSNLVIEGWIYGLNFAVSIIPFLLIMNWLYYKTNRNIVVAIVFHITSGFFNEIFATHPDSKIIQTILLLIFSVVLVIKEHEFFFNRKILSTEPTKGNIKFTVS